MANTTRNLDAAIACAVERYQDRLTLRDLARAAALPTNTLTRMFNRRYGMSPMRWLWRFRTILAAECIARAPGWPLAEVATHCGFTSPAHFSRRFRELFQESPSSFRANYHERPDAAPAGDRDGVPCGARAAATERAMRRPPRESAPTVHSTAGGN